MTATLGAAAAALAGGTAGGAAGGAEPLACRGSATGGAEAACFASRPISGAARPSSSSVAVCHDAGGVSCSGACARRAGHSSSRPHRRACHTHSRSTQAVRAAPDPRLRPPVVIARLVVVLLLQPVVQPRRALLALHAAVPAEGRVLLHGGPAGPAEHDSALRHRSGDGPPTMSSPPRLPPRRHCVSRAAARCCHAAPLLQQCPAPTAGCTRPPLRPGTPSGLCRLAVPSRKHARMHFPCRHVAFATL